MPESSRPRRARRERKPQPIDAEINKLADAGLLRDGLISYENGRRNLRRAYALALRACRQARDWGRGFEQRHRRRHTAALTYKSLSKDCQQIGRELSSFIDRQGRSLLRHSIAGID